MALFSNLFFDAVLGIVVLVIFSEIVIPLWKGKPFFPSVRKLKTLIRKTKENVSQNNSNNNHSDPARDSHKSGQDI